jgi:hypothetical protein
MEMSLAAVTQLAAEINADDRFIVIAIGRFKLVEELTRQCADRMPWGVSVLPRDKPERRVTLWSPEQWTEYRDLVLEELAPAPPPQATAPVAAEPTASPGSVTAVRVTPTESQFLLF